MLYFVALNLEVCDFCSKFLHLNGLAFGKTPTLHHLGSQMLLQAKPKCLVEGMNYEK